MFFRKANFSSLTIMPFIQEKTSRDLLWPRLNTPYKWYKIYVHSLFNPPLVQAVVYPGQGVLGGAYPSHGLLPWMCSYNGLKCCLWLAETMNDCSACSVFNYIPDLHSWETSAAVVGKWAAAWENRKFSLNSTLSLCIPRTSLSSHSTDRWWTFTTAQP